MEFVKFDDLEYLDEYVNALSGEVVVFCGFYNDKPLFHRVGEKKLFSASYLCKLDIFDYVANKNIYRLPCEIK